MNSSILSTISNSNKSCGQIVHQNAQKCKSILSESDELISKSMKDISKAIESGNNNNFFWIIIFVMFIGAYISQS
jgi:hypothetical protein